MATPRCKAVFLLLLIVCLLLADSEGRPQDITDQHTKKQDGNMSSAVNDSNIVPHHSTSSRKSRHHELEDDNDNLRRELVADGISERKGKDDSHTIPHLPEIDTLFSSPRSSNKSPHVPIRDSIKSVAHQLLSSRHTEPDTNVDAMVDADIRTPPKLKSQLQKQHSIDKFDSHVNDDERTHHGVAVPVIIEDEEDFEKTMERLDHVSPATTTKAAPQISKKTTSTIRTEFSEGLSTWVLLSGSNVTTPSLVNKKTHKTAGTTTVKTTPLPSVSKVITPAPSKKPLRTTISPTTGGKLTTKNDAVKNNSVYDKIIPTDIVNSTVTKTSHAASNVETNYKEQNSHRQNINKKKTNSEISTTKPLALAMTRRPHPATAKPIKNNTFDEVIPTRRKPTTTSTTTKVSTSTEVVSIASNINKRIDFVPTTVDDISTEISTETANSGIENSSETTTKRTRRPGSGSKKRKKNKNRRRNPANKSEGLAESKVTNVELNSTKLSPASKERPLSTRIYNYIAREVMPSVGFGLLGLVFTAGLAGLMMYPFSTGAAKRTYEEYHISPGNGYYYSGSYNSADGGQSEEEVFGKVLAGMNKDGISSFDALSEDSKFVSDNQETSYSSPNSQGTSYSSVNNQGTSYPLPHNQGTSYSATNKQDTPHTSSNNQETSYPSSNTQGTSYPSSVKESDNRYGVGRIETSQEIVYPSNSVKYNGFQASSYPTQYTYPERVKYNNGQQIGSSDIMYDGNVQYRQVTVGTSYRGQDPDMQPQVVSMKIDPPLVDKMNHSESKFTPIYNGDSLSNTAHISQRGPIAPPVVEHGPRSLRKRREISASEVNDLENDIDNEIFPTHKTKFDIDKKTDMPSKPNPTQSSAAEKPVTSEAGTTQNDVSSQVEVFSTNIYDSNIAAQESETTTEEPVVTTDSESDGEATTNLLTEQSTSSDTTTQPTSSSSIPVESTSKENNRNPDISTTSTSTEANNIDSTQSQDNFSVLSFFKNLLQFKIRLGLNILKNSSQAVTKYIETVQKRMDKEAGKNQVQRRNSTNIQEIRNRIARG